MSRTDFSSCSDFTRRKIEEGALGAMAETERHTNCNVFCTADEVSVWTEEHLGLQYTEEEVALVLQNNPNFRNVGSFERYFELAP